MYRSATFRYQEQGDWLLTDRLAPCPPVERGWNYIRQSLERHDSADIDYRYSKVVIESLLVHDQDSVAPPWLLRTLTVRQALEKVFFEVSITNPGE